MESVKRWDLEEDFGPLWGAWKGSATWAFFSLCSLATRGLVRLHHRLSPRSTTSFYLVLDRKAADMEQNLPDCELK